MTLSLSAAGPLLRPPGGDTPRLQVVLGTSGFEVLTPRSAALQRSGPELADPQQM
jgi:hypothetical protein